MAKATAMGLYVVGKLMQVEDFTTKNGRVFKRLIVYFGDSKNLVILAPHDTNLPPEGASVSLPLRSINVSEQGEVSALLRADAETNSTGGTA